ncbi:MAG: hypothetical protein WC449_05105 [Candidatus Paceibacterota bacterium]
MKRTYSVEELKSVNNSMMNYTVSFKYFGTTGQIKVHVGLVGNHFEIINNLVKKQYGDKAEVIGAKVTGKAW